ncbi:MFS transporter [Falsiroseomonas selenitidurans]|uniref:MFS transporter n=1 Tax=Falsiroseomonas selenitidurans TaxID=2716335 RepID=A0ABX1EAT4_9PROT|nr:MFS transporter [Falsiroseomonas selenitidurans]NKC32035.1 MFS transporter [Falsiroseomonas selenitidurans]
MTPAPAPALLPAAVGVTLGAQALVVLASLALSVTAALVLPALGLPKAAVGWYAAALFVASAAATLVTPQLVAGLGPVRLHQAMLLLAGLGLLALALGHVAALAASALLIGLAYGPANPASSALLARLSPPHLRNRVFSIKQIAVPLGGATAGLLLPALAAGLGWQAALALLGGVLLAAMLAIAPWRRKLDAGFLQPGGPAQPLWLPFAVLREGGPALRLGATALSFACVQFTYSAFVPTLLVSVAGWSLAGAGLVLTVGLAVSVAARLVLGWVADRVAPPLVLGALGVVMAAACLAGMGLGPGTPSWLALLVAGVLGFAAFGWNGICLAETARLAPPGRVAAATSGTMMMVYAGACLGPALFGAALAATGGPVAGLVLLALFGLAPLAWLRREAPQPTG